MVRAGGDRCGQPTPNGLGEHDAFRLGGDHVLGHDLPSPAESDIAFPAHNRGRAGARRRAPIRGTAGHTIISVPPPSLHVRIRKEPSVGASE